VIGPSGRRTAFDARKKTRSRRAGAAAAGSNERGRIGIRPIGRGRGPDRIQQVSAALSIDVRAAPVEAPLSVRARHGLVI